MRDLPSLGDYDGRFVHPRIAVGACPRPAHVPRFVEAGIRGIVDARANMLREHIRYVCSLPDSIYWKMLGTWDGAYPNDDWTARREDREPAATSVCPAYMAFIVEEMAKVVRDHSPVLVHCGGGIGRSGNLAAVAVAALEGLTVDEALERMRVHRPVLAGWDPRRYPGTDPGALVTLAKEVLGGPSE